MSPSLYSSDELSYQRKSKLQILSLFAVICVLVLTARLFYLQYILYEENLRLSESNRIRQIVVKADRGNILDRNGRVLVRNRPSHQISLLGYQLHEPDKVLSRLLKIKDSTGIAVFDSAFTTWVFEQSKWNKFKPLRLLEDASMQQVSIIEEHHADLPGIFTLTEARRDYPYGSLAAHTLGYTGEISEDQLKEDRFSEYTQGDRIGQKGLEQYYETVFKGKNGNRFVEVNAYGKEIRVLEGMHNLTQIPGNDMVTTIDIGLQRVLEYSFPDSIKGAAVALDPRTGEILAILSSPALDPNIFSLERKQLAKEWANVALDSDRPLNNRAIVGTYPPGSTFKLFTAIAGLINKTVSSTDRPYKSCNGGFQFGSRYQRCWKKTGHGTMNLIDAIRESCNVYFFQLGLELGMDKINEASSMYGLGRKTGVDLPYEKSGLLMDEPTYNERFKKIGWRWSRGQILNLAIGQGELVTPLQVASAFGAMVYNKGVYKPHLMKEIRDENGKIIEAYRPELTAPAKLDSLNHALIVGALEEVVSAPGGTARRSRVEGVRVGGKTGSSENPHGDLTHGWYVAVAPLDNPEIAFAVVLENAGHGGSVAAPVAGDVLNFFFRGTLPVGMSEVVFHD
jgi:penicillin-binding protein 2